MSQAVIETSTGWMIRCPVCTFHVFPKKGKPGASWTFNGDLHKPTFSPSMNSLVKYSEAQCEEDRRPDRRCHFIINSGMMAFCVDCTHEYAGKVIPMLEWSEAEVAVYRRQR